MLGLSDKKTTRMQDPGADDTVETAQRACITDRLARQKSNQEQRMRDGHVAIIVELPC